MSAPPVDPGARADLEEVAVAQLRADSLAAARAARPPRPQFPPGVDHADVVVPGEPALRLRIHRRAGTTGSARGSAVPGILAMHGGGFVLGDAAVDDALFEVWCRRFDCVGVSVDYRLAPETPYPGALDDCHRALAWMRGHADELGIDPARIGVFGVSAGGGLAAGLSLLVRDRGETPVAFQALLYPMLDDRQVTVSSRWPDVPRWDPGSNGFGWQSYLGARYGTQDVPPYAAPARADDLGGLPPTCVVVGTADAFLDEDVAFAQRAWHTGVPTELHVFAGGYHGFAAPACGSPLAERARKAIDDWMAARLQEASLTAEGTR